MRLLMIQGDHVSVFEERRRLALFRGASGLDEETAEQLRQASANTLITTPIVAEEEDEYV